MSSPKLLRLLQRSFSSGLFWLVVLVIVLGSIFTLEAVHAEIMAEYVNPALWIITNLILFGGYIALAFYVVIYGFVFDWIKLPDGAPNVGGRLIFNLTASLGAIVALLVVQIFLVPTTGRPWYIAPPQPVFWLPSARFLIYSWLVGTIFAMSITLGIRIKRAQPMQFTVTPRESREPEPKEPTDA